jgi:hypothetical protein
MFDDVCIGGQGAELNPRRPCIAWLAGYRAGAILTLKNQYKHIDAIYI